MAKNSNGVIDSHLRTMFEAYKIAGGIIASVPIPFLPAALRATTSNDYERIEVERITSPYGVGR